MRSRLKAAAYTLAITTALVAPTLVQAQDVQRRTLPGTNVNPNVSIEERPRPEYDPIGIRAGSFLVFPELTVGGLYDDNVFADSDDEESDFAVEVLPQIDVQSNWNVHELNLSVGGEAAYYADFDELNYTDLYALADGQLEITRDNLLNGRLGVLRLHEDPDSPDSDTGSGEDVLTYVQQRAGLDFRHNFNRLYFIVGGDFLRNDFEDDDGDNELADGDNDDDRDRNQYRARVRVGYELSPRLDVFSEGRYDIRRYDNTPDDGGVDRNSEGIDGRVGVNVDFTSILFGEASVGYTHRTYDDNDLESSGGISYSAALTWNVTTLTTITLEGSADVLESTVTFEDDQASGNYQKALELDVWHELRRNILLNGNAAYIRDDFEDTERSDDSVSVGAGLRYLLNRRLSLDATYSFTDRSSDADDSEYSRNLVRLGVTAAL